MLRSLVNRPPGQAVVLSTSVKDVPLAVSQVIFTARRTLEALLVYAVTQLAMWLSKPDFDPAATEEAEEHPAGQLDASKGRAPRALAERLRRGMTGEMTADLQALLTRAKPVLAKCDAGMDKAEGDLTVVLSRFLTERIVVPT